MWAAVLAALAMLVSVAMVSGCADDDGASEGTTTAASASVAVGSTETTDMTATTSTTATTAPAETGVETADTATDDVAQAVGTIWFANEDGALVGEARAGAAMSVRAALTELAAGPEDETLVPAFPVGAAVVGTDLEGSVVIVEMNAAFEEGYPSGSAAEIATVAPIVYTATELPGVDAVRLEVGGAPLAPPTAQLDLSADLTRADLPMTLVPPDGTP